MKIILKNHLKFIGPGLVASVAYCDPGNWATDLEAGSSHGYAHLFVILSASVMASILQVLATRLGFITGKDLAQHCRERFYERPQRKLLWRWGVLYPLYVLCECGIIFTDLAELLGSAIALHMLFPRLPLFVGVLLTSMDVFLVLAFFNSYPEVSKNSRTSMHLFEFFVSALILMVVVSFIILLVSVKPDWAQVFEGFIPNQRMIVNGGLYVAVSLIGATVMPHSIFLGSKVAILERLPSSVCGESLPQESENVYMLETIHTSLPEKQDSTPSPELERQRNLEIVATKARIGSVKHVRTHLAHASFDIVFSLLSLALPINAAILIVASAAFYYSPASKSGEPQTIDLHSAFELLGSRVGVISGYLFAIALLIAGQAASITVTLAGQIVSEGFLEWRTIPVVRRLLTRMIGIVPSAVVAGAAGLQGVDALLVGSQVGLSLVLPFVLAPLIIFTSDPKIMCVKDNDAELVRFKSNELRSQYDVPKEGPLNKVADVNETKETLTSVNDSVVSFANGWVLKTAIWVIFTLCSGSNLYAIIQLAQGST